MEIVSIDPEQMHEDSDESSDVSESEDSDISSNMDVDESLDQPLELLDGLFEDVSFVEPLLDEEMDFNLENYLSSESNASGESSDKENRAKSSEEELMKITENLLIGNEMVKPLKEIEKENEVNKLKATETIEVDTVRVMNEVKMTGKVNKSKPNEKIEVDIVRVKTPKKQSRVKQHKGNENTIRNLDGFSEAIQSSLFIVHRKPNLEKRRNSEMRPRLSYFKENPLNLKTFLNNKKEKCLKSVPVTKESHNAVPVPECMAEDSHTAIAAPQHDPKVITEIRNDSDSNITLKKRISLQEYRKRKNMA